MAVTATKDRVNHMQHTITAPQPIRASLPLGLLLM